MCAPRTSLMGRLALGFTIYFEYGFWTSYFGRFWPKDPTSSLQPLYHFLLTLATIVLSFWLFSQPFNNLFSFPISRIYSPKLVEKIMITLMASGRGGPMLLLLSGCLVGNGVWWGWHWNWFPLRGGNVRRWSLSRSRRASRLWLSLSEMGFSEQLPGHELMGIYFNQLA